VKRHFISPILIRGTNFTKGEGFQVLEWQTVIFHFSDQNERFQLGVKERYIWADAINIIITLVIHF
jgi:hypothetical protein